MSKRINVNPDHYKVGGRERQGGDIVVDEERETLSRARRTLKRRGPHIPNQERAARRPPRRKTESS